MSEASASDFQRIHLERLKLAADVLLSEADDLSSSLEAELFLFKESVETSLLRQVAPSS